MVDDDPSVRALVGEMLRELGYDVCEASCAQTALKILGRGLPITTIITDIRMPDISGIQLADAVGRHRPNLRIIYMTAYAKEAAAGSAQLLRHDVLVKPFTFEQLESLMGVGERQRH